MRSKQIVPGDQISFNLRSAVLQEDGTLLYGSLVVRSAGSFLREILKRPIGGTDYKRLTVHTQDGFFPWYSPSLNEERFQFRLTEEPDVDVYRRKLEIVLLHMGVKNVATILYDPFATQFNHETIEDTAENLLLSRLPLNEDATFEECLDALDLHLPVVRRLQEVAGDLVPIYGRRETACIAIEFAAKSYRRLNISTPFPEKCIAETNFPFASDDKVIFNMTKNPQILPNKWPGLLE